MRSHCEDHALEGELNVVENRCISCNLVEILNEYDKCQFCDGEKDRPFLRRKEDRIKNLLFSNDVVFKHDVIPYETQCGRERPDFIIDCVTHFLIIEVDEHQHQNYPSGCEQPRMINITQALGGKSVFWIRYNPDSFKHKDGTHAQLSNARREAHLIDWIKWSFANVPTHLGEVMYLFYDNCNEQSIPSEIIALPQI
jgi:hypothetical protein